MPSLRPAESALTQLPHRSASLIGRHRLRFLNHEGCVSLPEDWNAPDSDKLWLYNLHYFDDLNADNAQVRESWHLDLLQRWVTENPPTLGNGWEPYPTSLRIVNWIKWSHAGHTLPQECLDSLVLQVRWLKKRLEWHLLGNHLWANAKALVFAGIFYHGEESRAWLNVGLEILNKEISEQILMDGGHFERSPMYHAIIFEDLLDLVNLVGAYRDVISEAQVDMWRSQAASMLSWLQLMCHPDGEFALFNDAAFEIAKCPSELFAYASRLGILADTDSGDSCVQHLEDSGYIRVSVGPATAFLDVAPVGPDYLPGHAHADTLSFELSLCAQRLLVNSGTSVYGSAEERQRQRGTLAHNTVCINKEDSSEVWGGFRVARRARPFDVDIRETAAEIEIRAAHDGYQRLPGRPIHRRRWCFFSDGMTVHDSLEGRFNRAVARYHFHPDIELSRLADGRIRACRVGREVAQMCVSDGIARILHTTYHPEFGKSIPNQCLHVEMRSPTCSVTFTWS